jgi:hypothetical protein
MRRLSTAVAWAKEIRGWALPPFFLRYLFLGQPSNFSIVCATLSKQTHCPHNVEIAVYRKELSAQPRMDLGWNPKRVGNVDRTIRQWNIVQLRKLNRAGQVQW